MNKKPVISSSVLDKVGKTPLIQLKLSCLSQINLYAKLEFYNPTGSAKDRAACYIIEKLLKNKEIDAETIILESSSGNFGIALSAYCKRRGLKFICVVDPNITAANETIIKSMCTKMIKVTEPDNNGGYLLRRIQKVKELLSELPNAYWVNQYGNPYNAEAYHSLGNEIYNELDDIDYVFVAVSSGGTITGVSQRMKELYPKIKVIAVDSVGSVIFGGTPQKRYIPGIGSSITPEILKKALIDEVIIIGEADAAKMCHLLLNECSILAGGSSGSLISAMRKYFSGKKYLEKPNVVTILPDRGDRYLSTIYNEEWSRRLS